MVTFNQSSACVCGCVCVCVRTRTHYEVSYYIIFKGEEVAELTVKSQQQIS